MPVPPLSLVPSHLNCLQVISARLKADNNTQGPGDLYSLGLTDDTIANHILQDKRLPTLRFRWEQAGEWDTKDSAGHDGWYIVDIWVSERGDKKALQIADRVIALLHNLPFTITNTANPAQSLILRHDFMDAFVEPDGTTHHTVLRFQHIVTN